MTPIAGKISDSNELCIINELMAAIAAIDLNNRNRWSAQSGKKRSLFETVMEKMRSRARVPAILNDATRLVRSKTPFTLIVWCIERSFPPVYS